LNDVALRPVSSGDIDFLETVYASTRADELAVVPWTDEQKAAFVHFQFEAQRAHYEAHYTDTSWDVIVVDGEPAGRLYVARWANEVRIVDITLLPAFRGGGVGTQLLHGLIDEAERRAVPLSIHVEVNNPAVSLYERLGFRPVAEQGVYRRWERQPKTAS
jgi:ribosomal protein S18 acetylase RimI-like enzyme